jgi:hypothetical protein
VDDALVGAAVAEERDNHAIGLVEPVGQRRPGADW